MLPRLAPLFAVQTFASTVNVSLIFLLPDLLLSRRAASWIVEGGGHFALVAGSCLALVPAGHASDRWGARRVLVVANAAAFVLFATLLDPHRRLPARPRDRGRGRAPSTG